MCYETQDDPHGALIKTEVDPSYHTCVPGAHLVTQPRRTIAATAWMAAVETPPPIECIRNQTTSAPTVARVRSSSDSASPSTTSTRCYTEDSGFDASRTSTRVDQPSSSRRSITRPPTYLVAPVAFQVRLPTTIKCTNATLCARIWVDPFLDREQQPMTLPPFTNTIAGQLSH